MLIVYRLKNLRTIIKMLNNYNHIRLTFVAVCMALLFFGCERDANVDVPLSKAKLVMRSFISPTDSVIAVDIFASQPLFNSSQQNNKFDTSAAQVFISNGSVEFPLIYNSTKRQFQINVLQAFPVTAGQTYYLRATHPSYDAVDASCTVPVSTIDNVKATVDITDPYEVFADVSFFDIAGQKNYYRVHAQNVWIPDFSYFGVDTVVFADFLFDVNNFYSDEGNDGKEIKSKLLNYYSYHPGDSTDIYVLNVDENYYRFHRSVFTTGGGDPFSEATPAYSNINNGVGIFAAYTQFRKRVF